MSRGRDERLYVAKPIRVDELVAAIKRTPQRPGGPEPAPAVTSGSEPIDTSSLVRLLDGTGGDKEFVGELVEQFLNDAPGLVDAARKGLEAREVDEVRRAAHTLKSNAATFGARALSDRSRELEDAAKQGTLDDAETRIDRIADELADVRSALPAAWGTVATPSAD